MPYKGPLIWVIILVLLQGFCGMTLGQYLCIEIELLVPCPMKPEVPMVFVDVRLSVHLSEVVYGQ